MIFIILFFLPVIALLAGFVILSIVYAILRFGPALKNLMTLKVW
jgi:hypothetical protein